MMRRARQLFPALSGALVLFIGGMFSVTGYTLWRLQVEAVTNGLKIAEMHAHNVEGFLTQSLHVTALAAANAVPLKKSAPDLHRVERSFVATLRHAPFLRSMSLLDERGRIIASSNPANVGVIVPTQSYLPAGSATLDTLRIGQPWSGRDFAGGSPATAQVPVEADAQSFIPVTLRVEDSNVTLLIALNPDYFINHVSQSLDARAGSVEVLRYDSTLLMATDPTEHAGSLRDYVVRDLRLTQVESGKFEQDDGKGRQVLTAFRASRLYPFVVMIHLDRAYALQEWQTEAKTLLGVVIPTLLVLSLLALALYRRQLQLAAQRLQRINATVFDASAEAIIIADPKVNIMSVNAAFTGMTGYSAEEVIGRNPRLLASDRQDSSFYERLWKDLLQDGVWHGEMINRRKDGSLYDARITITISRDGAGGVQHFIAVTRDITEHKQTEKKLHLAASVFSHAGEGIMITTMDGTIIDVNDAFTHITGYTRDDVLGRNPRILSSGREGPEFYATMWRGLSDEGHWSGEVWNRRKNGEVYPEMQTISTVLDAHGKPQHYVSLFSDISALKAHQKQLEHIAHFDALTSLPNRVLLADRMQQAIAQAQRRGQLLAVAYLDLDDFKAINDRHGHEAGDQLLVALATRMKQALREGDTLARIGGDEFVVVLVDLTDVAASVPMFNRLLAAAAQPMHFGDVVLQVSASLGVTFYPQAEDADADKLLRQADQAMYQAKLVGRNRYHVFDAEQDRSVRGHHESVERIRLALQEGEFVLYYQPKVNMRRGTVIGVEALIRWQHPEKGLLPPAVFLPVIENHPLAIDIGEWVINTALCQMALWRAGGLDMPISVNIGARQLQQADFVLRLRTILARHPEIMPNRLEFEVLETSALEDIAHVSRVISACRKIGVTFCLDDFGTGYSSLTYLKLLPVNLLKIDQTFVRGMLNDPGDLTIVEGVIGLARAFRRPIIAEGVETVEHGTMLLQLGCELAQGYGIARPMPADAFPAWSATWHPEPTWVNLPTLSRDDLPLLFASAEHRAWVVAIGDFLQCEQDALPPLDTHQYPFGHWVGTEGLAHYSAQPSFQAIERLHQQTHALATELLELKAQGRNPEALARLGELHALRDALLEHLKSLLQVRQPVGLA